MCLEWRGHHRLKGHLNMETWAQPVRGGVLTLLPATHGASEEQGQDGYLISVPTCAPRPFRTLPGMRRVRGEPLYTCVGQLQQKVRGVWGRHLWADSIGILAKIPEGVPQLLSSQPWQQVLFSEQYALPGIFPGSSAAPSLREAAGMANSTPSSLSYLTGTGMLALKNMGEEHGPHTCLMCAFISQLPMSGSPDPFHCWLLSHWFRTNKVTLTALNGCLQTQWPSSSWDWKD